jgi:hypothetical protein
VVGSCEHSNETLGSIKTMVHTSQKSFLFSVYYNEIYSNGMENIAIYYIKAPYKCKKKSS